MIRVFVSACHSPEEVVSSLYKSGRNASFYMCPYGAHITQDIPITVQNILFACAKDFSKNFRWVMAHPKLNFFVFDGPCALLEYTGVHRLDMEVIKSKTGRLSYALYDFIDVDLYDTATLKVIKKRKTTYVQRLIEDVRKGSLLNALMTFIYKLPVKTHQKPVRMLCANCLIKNWSVKRLEKEIETLGKQITLSPAVVDNLKTILLCDVATRLKAAFGECKNFEDVQQHADNHEVSAYEMRYLLKSLANEVNSKKTVDSFLDGKVKNG